MLMSEIRSVAEVAGAYVAEIRSSAKNLASDGTSVTKDRITSLVVNKNGMSLSKLSNKAKISVAKQITDDCGRITSVASLFEEKDQTLARGLK